MLIKVSKEFSIVMQVQQLEDCFMHRWKKYCQGIVDFADATKHKSKELKHALRHEDSSTEGKNVRQTTCVPHCIFPLYM